MKFTAACVQLNSGREIEPNIRLAADLVRRARDAGADLIMTPEVSDMIEPKRALRGEKARDETSHPMLAAFCDLAGETGAHLLLGSIMVREDRAERSSTARSLSRPIGPFSGATTRSTCSTSICRAARAIANRAVFRPGNAAVRAQLPGDAGDELCYDLRFPHLYRALALGGADFLSIPAAFTVPTGKAHWHVLLRARAIENGCFVFAPAQCGEHAEGRRTYGHSLIVAPWGEILAEAGDAVGFVTAVIDTDRVAEARRAVPSLLHDRPFADPQKRSPGGRISDVLALDPADRQTI